MRVPSRGVVLSVALALLLATTARPAVVAQPCEEGRAAGTDEAEQLETVVRRLVAAVTGVRSLMVAAHAEEGGRAREFGAIPQPAEPDTALRMGEPLEARAAGDEATLTVAVSNGRVARTVHFGLLREGGVWRVETVNPAERDADGCYRPIMPAGTIEQDPEGASAEDRTRGEDAAGDRRRGREVPTETLFETTLAEDELPPTDRAVAALWYATIEPGERAVVPSDPDADSPRPTVHHVLAGDVTLRVDGPARITRAGSAGAPTRTEAVPPGEEVALRAGDSAVWSFGQTAELVNAGPGTARLLVGGVFAGIVPPAPAGYAFYKASEPDPEAAAWSLPSGLVMATLWRADFGSWADVPFPGPRRKDEARVVLDPADPELECPLPYVGYPEYACGAEHVVLYALTLHPPGTEVEPPPSLPPTRVPDRPGRDDEGTAEDTTRGDDPARRDDEAATGRDPGGAPADAAEEGIHVVDADGSGPALLARGGRDPAWSPDGTMFAFAGDKGIEVVGADGSGRTTVAAGSGFYPAWSPDGTRIAFSAYPSPDDAFRDLYVVDADGSGKVRVASTPIDDVSLAWSPDGTRIAFATSGYLGN